MEMVQSLNDTMFNLVKITERLVEQRKKKKISQEEFKVEAENIKIYKADIETRLEIAHSMEKQDLELAEFPPEE